VNKHAMAKAYSDDLRRKLLEAHDRGDGSLRELAKRFRVSVPWAWKISCQRRRTRRMERVERVEQRHGPRSPRDGSGTGNSARTGAAGARPDAGGVTTTSVGERAGQGKQAASLARAPEHGAAAEKSHSTPTNKTRSRSKPVVWRGGRR